MGKGKKKRNQQRSAPPAKKPKFTARSTAPSGPPVVTRNKVPSTVLLPPPYPSHLKFPQKDFLRNIDSYKESFEQAINTSYEGFVVDEEQSSSGQNDSSLFDHERIQRSLKKMDECGIFRTDVTQPFGLGTKCAKTYVTRCLLGDEGTTYKYLGLRMFAHPWDVHASTSAPKNTDNALKDMILKDAMGEISTLNRNLTERTKTHLENLKEKRSERLGFNNGQPYTNGRASYDIALINRMTNAPDLKVEPTIGRDKSAVSWHADSSLEHYSSIAVYQTIISEDDCDHNDGANDANTFSRENELASNWAVALRVAHNSEGPQASRRGTNIDSSVVTDTPAISVSLPSRSAYYLLDDFNHHHQHAVLLHENGARSASAGVRYASTHRLLRESHNVNFMLERCRSACSQFHKKGPKIWRSEQLLLSEIESDWIRQFYIQGQGHKDNLWEHWEKPICELLKYWGKLEDRTKQVVDLLQYASMARCGMHEKKDDDKVPPRSQRKMREKQKKALKALEDLMNRGSANDDIDGDIESVIYGPFCALLEERAKMRALWKEREQDGVFHSMSADYRPLPVPFRFGTISNNSNSTERIAEIGESPLVGGTPNDLVELSTRLKTFGTAYISANTSDLPKVETSKVPSKQLVGMSSVKLKDDTKNDTQTSEQPDENPINSYSKNGCTEQEIKRVSKNVVEIEKPIITAPEDHLKDLQWKGWNSIKVGLEMQEPWACLLLKGKKTIETRAYDIPKILIGKKIDILESKRGKDGFSSLPNQIVGEECHQFIKRRGWCIFDKVIIYRYRRKFEADEEKHLVKADSNYGWKDDTKVVYGWVVSKCGKYKESKKGNSPKPIQCATRRMRSLFEIK